MYETIVVAYYVVKTIPRLRGCLVKNNFAKSDALVFSYRNLIDTKVPLPKNPSWFDVLGVEEDDIKDCCYRIMCLYDRKKVCLNIREHILKTFKYSLFCNAY